MKFSKKKKNNPISHRKQRRKPDEIKETILALLKENGDMASSELAVALGYPRVVNSLALAIKTLMNEGKIEYTDKKNRFSRNQKLHLTKQ